MLINSDAKRILCFGDSNTWGYIPGTYPRIKRYDINLRWTGILQKMLGTDYDVIEEGMHGRTIDSNDPKSKQDDNRKGRNGIEYLVPCLKTHQPLDIVIVSLGKNDLKGRYKKKAGDIIDGYKKIINIINNLEYDVQKMPPKVILVPPVDIDYKKAGELRGFPRDVLRKIEKIFELLPKTGLKNTYVLDLRKDIQTGIDGLHVDCENHGKLAALLKKEINRISNNFRSGTIE